ncbi:hypothetical protein [Pseudomonas jessenii]|uniref:hypothetical protein n=1 Tax=Pseudomonas jessenii TaxID=77298 RepID=UPI0030BC6B0D
MNGYEFAATLVKSLAWPIVTLIVLYMCRGQISTIVDRIKLLKASKDGLEMTMAEASKELISKEHTPAVEKRIKEEQTLERGTINGGVYALYANGVIVSRQKIKIPAGESSRHLVLPVAMVNEPTSIQFIGDIQANVQSLTNGSVSFKFDPSSSDRTVEVIVSGL